MVCSGRITRARGFLPHGTKKDGFAERQPVWLTEADENPNSANVLFLIDGADSSRVGEYDLCCEMFDGRDDLAVAGQDHWKRRRRRAFAHLLATDGARRLGKEGRKPGRNHLE